MKKIRSYCELNIDGFAIRCPYFINKSKFNLWKNINFLGKGDSQGIIETAKTLIDKDKMPPEIKSSKSIRKYMKENNLGIDCSGFVTRILDCWCREKYGKSLFRLVYIKLPFVKKIRYFFRPFENTSVEILLHHMDKKMIIKNSGDIRPGDLIHLGESHVLIVSQIFQDNNKLAREISYFHCSSRFDGVHQGKINIINPNLELGKQFWKEGSKEHNWTYQEYMRYHNSGVVRLKIFNENNNK